MGLSNARNGINRIGGGVERYQLAKKDVETKGKRGLLGLLRGSTDKSSATKTPKAKETRAISATPAKSAPTKSATSKTTAKPAVKAAAKHRASVRECVA
jgi:hypothetical protein